MRRAIEPPSVVREQRRRFDAAHWPGASSYFLERAMHVSYRKLGAEFNFSRQRAHQVFRQISVRGTKKPWKPDLGRPDVSREAIELLAAHCESIGEIAAALNTSYETVKRRALQYAIRLPDGRFSPCRPDVTPERIAWFAPRRRSINAIARALHTSAMTVVRRALRHGIILPKADPRGFAVVHAKRRVRAEAVCKRIVELANRGVAQAEIAVQLRMSLRTLRYYDRRYQLGVSDRELRPAR